MGRGQAIVAPVSDEKVTHARVEAFMAVDLFKKVYDQYHGTRWVYLVRGRPFGGARCISNPKSP